MDYVKDVDVSKLIWGSALISLHPVKCPGMWMVIFHQQLATCSLL